MARQVKVKKKKKVKVAPEGVAHIKATFNNTIITLSDKYGNAIAWASAGTVGFKGSRKNTPFAAAQAAQKATSDALGLGLKKVQVQINGPGAGRESAVRGLRTSGLIVESILDVTPLPHNGCRPPKRRRV